MNHAMLWPELDPALRVELDHFLYVGNRDDSTAGKRERGLVSQQLNRFPVKSSRDVKEQRATMIRAPLAHLDRLFPAKNQIRPWLLDTQSRWYFP
jgi:hypothetical protein